jgi:DNA-directed RNA polymerase subunit F
MEKLPTNYAKKLAKLHYKDEILKMYEELVSIREITEKINYRLARTNLKTSLSKSTIAEIIKKYKEKK